MNADRPFVGIMLMLGFCILAPVGDSIAKLLGDKVPLLQLLVVRFLLQVVILLPLVWWTKRQMIVTRRISTLTVARSALHIIGIGAMFLSLRYLPLADAVAIAFVMPFIMLLLGKTVLNEEIGSHRLAACAIGFVGTLLVIQPNFANVGWPALLPVVVAIDFALFMLVTRQIAKDIDPIALQAISGMIALLILAPTTFLLDTPLLWPQPEPFAWFLLIMLGVFGTTAHLFMTWSLRFAPSATLAPMQYLEIPIATFFGWLIFSDLPNGLAAVGIIVTVASGLYIIRREQILARNLIPQPVGSGAEG